MVQYCSGGKWGLLIRRPLEAMSRTLSLTFLYFLPIVIFGHSRSSTSGRQYAGRGERAEAGPHHEGAGARHHLQEARMLNPVSFWVASIICFAIWLGFTTC